MMLGTRPSTPGAATAEALSANLEQMKSVEQLRRVYRDLKDLKTRIPTRRHSRHRGATRAVGAT
jgi:hypothetical protein